MRVLRPQSRHLQVWAVIVVLVLVAVVLVVTRKVPTRGPTAPYDHSGFSEQSVASEDIVAGQARTVTQGLVQLGFWCVQPRYNDQAVQIACRSAEYDMDIDVVAAPDGDVLYAEIDLGNADTSAGPRDHLDQALVASFLKLWPQDRQTIQDLIEQAQPHSFMALGGEAPPASEADQYSTTEERTDNATWSLWSRYTGQPLALRIRTTGLQDHTWPFGGEHYATSVDAATAALVADGSTCATACSPASDVQSLDFEEHDGQIVAIHFTLRSRLVDLDSRAPSRSWAQVSLALLSPAVQPAIAQRVEQQRIEQRSWRGVVAGTPVEIVSAPGAATTPDNRPATDLWVTIGIPLLYPE